jgi:D-alanyl-D-alanine carboxypeptidase
MPSRLLALAALLLLLPVPALAGAKEKVAAMAPSGLVLVVDEQGNELIAQNADKPFVPASVTKIVTAWRSWAASTGLRQASTSTTSGCCMCAGAVIRF